MTFFDFLSLIGGLALFLYGMEVLGDGLSKVTGGKLEKLLEKLTSNPIKAVLLGAGVTAVIQSSSATTVMVVGLVNSSMINLNQAVGIIMGANIGTTITSWILSLAGIESSNFFIRMLKPSSFSPIIAIIGIALIMFSKKEKKRNIGTIMIGFAVLMYGMDAMSDAVEPLADIPEFKNLFIMFKNPILGMLAGLVLTSIIQSSSASVGILQALCMTGLVPFASAIPIIMGQNIGTCVTALLSSIGASKNGKRAALMHLYFNLIGTILFMIIFYAINSVVHFSFMEEAATPVDIAIIHSTFNISATIVLLPFSSLLLKLSTLTIPEVKDEESLELSKMQESLRLLDDLFLERPAFALEQCRLVVNSMSDLTKKCLFKAIDSIGSSDDKKYEKIRKMEKDTDTYDDAISNYLVKLSTKDLQDKDRKYINTLFHIVGNFERISDHAYNIAQSAKALSDKNLELSEIAYKELEVYTNAIREIIDKSFLYFQETDFVKAREIEPLEELIDVMTQELKDRHIKRLIENKCSIEVGFLWSDMITDFERIADHCSNIAVTVVEIYDPSVSPHTVKTTKDDKFINKFNQYKQEYVLPQEV